MSFRLGVVGLLLKVALPLLNVLALLCDGESKVKLFLIIIDIHSPENLPVLVWFRLGKKTSLQK